MADQKSMADQNSRSVDGLVKGMVEVVEGKRNCATWTTEGIMEMVLSLNPEWIFMCINRDFCETFKRGKYIVHRKPVRDCVKSLLSADGDHMDDKVVITICREQPDATVGPDFRVHFMNPAWHPVTYDKKMASLVG